jgi:4-aminobutyrate aminotransferase-like enzyme
MIGIECTTPALSLGTTRRLLERGYVALPSGDEGRVISLTPPLVISEEALEAACEGLRTSLVEEHRAAGRPS